ncbi:MAG: response regulator transcription factor [Chloroflexota bacterium]|nr:response regulator transcription factor [Chloroflexota bacterium]
MQAIRMLLVDDHILFRRGLISLLSTQKDMEVVGEAADGLEALEKTRELMPDIILMDITMPNCDGLEATRLILDEMPYVKIVMLTVSEEEGNLYESVKSGAKGYLLKNLEPDLLYGLIRSVAAGEAALSPVMASKILKEYAGQGAGVPEEVGRGQRTTAREEEILNLVVEGLGNKAIAQRLSISESTVRNHLHNILGKLQLQNRVQLAIYASRRGGSGKGSLGTRP